MGVIISVIIPTYNRASYVLETVNSVLGQTYNQVEVVVVDDGSTDNTKEVLNDLINTGRIIYQYQQNAGRSEARNHGAKLSTGEFLMFLDSDDLLQATALENLYQLTVQYPGSGVFAGKSGLFTENKKPWYNHSLNYSTTITDETDTADYFLNIGAFIIRREAFFNTTGFKKEFDPAEDIDFSIKALHDNKLTWSKDFVVVDKRRHVENTDDSKLHTSSYNSFIYYIQQIKANKLPRFNAEKSRMLSKFYECLLQECYFLDKKIKGVEFFGKMVFNDLSKIFSIKRWKMLLILLFQKKNQPSA